MGDVISLNRFKKKKARADKLRRAETNRRLHGRTKAERAAEAQAKERLEKKLRGARLERPVEGAAHATRRAVEASESGHSRVVVELRPEPPSQEQPQLDKPEPQKP